MNLELKNLRSRKQFSDLEKKEVNFERINMSNEILVFYAFEIINALMTKIKHESSNGLSISTSINVRLWKLENGRNIQIERMKKILLPYLFISIFEELLLNELGSNRLKRVLYKLLPSTDFFRLRKLGVEMKNKFNRENEDGYYSVDKSLISKVSKYLSTNDLIEFFEDAILMFSMLPFGSERIGGKLWAKIAELAKELVKENDLEKLSIIIDRIIDLEHNTGSVLTKGNAGLTISVSQEQPYPIKDVLNFKKNVKKISAVLNFAQQGKDAKTIDYLNYLSDSLKDLLKINGNQKWNTEISPFINEIM